MDCLLFVVISLEPQRSKGISTRSGECKRKFARPLTMALENVSLLASLSVEHNNRIRIIGMPLDEEDKRHVRLPDQMLSRLQKNPRPEAGHERFSGKRLIEQREH